MTVIRLNFRPRVFTSAFLENLARVNRACRWLRARGARVLALSFPEDGAPHIEIDRNLHALPPGSGDLSITVRR
jgi:hypothetical protein